jgi:hypothetical protein
LSEADGYQLSLIKAPFAQTLAVQRHRHYRLNQRQLQSVKQEFASQLTSRSHRLIFQRLN